MTDQQKVWKVGQWVGVLLIVFLAVVSIKTLRETSYVGKGMPMVNSISVNGKGEAISIPDVATFSFSVAENAKTVKEAQAKATEKINTALKAVRDGGVADKDIKTLSYNINPHYKNSGAPCTPYVCPVTVSVLDGYEVSQTIQVKVRDLSKAGELFDSLGGTGVKNVDSLAFSIDDIDSVKALARADAIVNADEKAKKIASALGVKIVRVMSFYDNSDDQYPTYAREGMGGDTMAVKAQVAPEIPQGEQKVVANVNVTYEIK